jgi:hypothetical protein
MGEVNRIKTAAGADANDLLLLIQEVEALRDRTARDCNSLIERLKALLPVAPGAARYARIRRLVRENGGWKGIMSNGKV